MLSKITIHTLQMIVVRDFNARIGMDDTEFPHFKFWKKDYLHYNIEEGECHSKGNFLNSFPSKSLILIDMSVMTQPYYPNINPFWYQLPDPPTLWLSIQIGILEW